LVAGAGGVVVPRGRGRDLVQGRDVAPPSAMADAGLTPLATSDAPLIIEVDDTTSALQALAHRVRRESGTKVVAITGSAGKTTTKEVTSEFLEKRYRVVRNRGE